MRDFQFSREQKLLKLWRQYSLPVILVLLISVIIFTAITYISRDKFQEKSKDFDQFIAKKQYKEALDLYRDVQNRATSGDADNKYIKLQDQYEKSLSSHMVGVVDKVLKNAEISQEDADMISSLEELGASSISPYFEQVTRDWLGQKRTYDEWLNLMNTFNHLPNLKLTTDNFLQQEPYLLKAAVVFSKPINLMSEQPENFSVIIPTWEEVIDNDEIGEYAKSYAQDLLDQYKERLLPVIMAKVDDFIEHRKSYSAKYLLDQMLEIFPENSEIISKMDSIGIDIGKKIVTWQGSVEAINVRVLRHDDSKPENNQGLLTPNQFKKLLQELYNHDYVLIDASVFSSYPDHPINVFVPEGKSPLLLTIDSVELNRQQVNSGSFTRIEYDEEKKQFFGEIGRSKSNPQLVYNEDVFSILNDFIHDNPDFSFDGARAIVSISGANGVLGHSLKVQHDQAISVLHVLEEEGYHIASNTYGRIDLGLDDVKAIEKDLKEWDNKIRAELNRPVRIMVLPFGSHPYNSEERLNAVLAEDYHLFIGIGPQLYNYAEEQYIHVDAVEINADSIAGNYFYLENIDDLSSVLP